MLVKGERKPAAQSRQPVKTWPSSHNEQCPAIVPHFQATDMSASPLLHSLEGAHRSDSPPGRKRIHPEPQPQLRYMVSASQVTDTFTAMVWLRRPRNLHTYLARCFVRDNHSFSQDTGGRTPALGRCFDAVRHVTRRNRMRIPS